MFNSRNTLVPCLPLVGDSQQVKGAFVLFEALKHDFTFSFCEGNDVNLSIATVSDNNIHRLFDDPCIETLMRPKNLVLMLRGGGGGFFFFFFKKKKKKEKEKENRICF